MSQQNLCPGPPKKFLKKGEGLKRFAAYKPPLPLSANKIQRRQTFVKFRLDNMIKKVDSNFLHPDILFDDSINLSTEIPKIAPPKIMHTPVRPIRQALGPSKAVNFNPFKVPDPPKEPVTPNDVEPKRYNLRGCRKAQNSENAPTIHVQTIERKEKKEPRRSRRQITAVVERHIPSPPSQQPSPPPTPIINKVRNQDVPFSVNPELSESQINGNIDKLLKKIEEKKTSLEGEMHNDNDEYNHREEIKQEESKVPWSEQRTRFDLSTPTPGSCILALGQQIEQIQATVNGLKDKVRNCQCGNLLATSSEAPASRTSKKVSKSKASDKKRPSAYADNSTLEIINSLIDELARLRTRFDDVNLRS